MSPGSSNIRLTRSMPWPEPEVISTSSGDAIHAARRPACRRRTRACQGNPAGPARLYSARLAPSRRSTDAAASANPSAGTCSGSLWPPMKLYFGNPVQRGAGGGRSLREQMAVRETGGGHGVYPLFDAVPDRHRRADPVITSSFAAQAWLAGTSAAMTATERSCSQRQRAGAYLPETCGVMSG